MEMYSSVDIHSFCTRLWAPSKWTTASSETWRCCESDSSLPIRNSLVILFLNNVCDSNSVLCLFALDDHSCYLERGRPPVHHQLIYPAALSRLHVGCHVPGRFPHDPWLPGKLFHRSRWNTFPVYPKLPADIWAHSPFGLYGDRAPTERGRFLPDWASDPVP